MKKIITKTMLVVGAMLVLAACTKQVNGPGMTGSETGIENKNGNGTIWNVSVPLSGLNEVPANNSGATGTASLRLTKNKVLYSTVTVENLQPDDALRFAHVHLAPAGSNGPVIITLCANAAQFGVQQEIQLTDMQFNQLLTANVYVNAHSNKYLPGIVRGQIR